MISVPSYEIPLPENGQITVTIAVDGGSCRMRVWEPIRKYLSETFDAIGQDHFRADHLTCDADGFFVVGRDAIIRIPPGRYWQDFVVAVFGGPFTLTDYNAVCSLQQLYYSYELHRIAERAANDVRAAKISTESLAETAPFLRHYQIVRDAVAEAVFARLPARPGPRGGSRQPPQAHELIAWLTFYKGTEQLSDLNAAAIAIERHPDLVPAEWRKDPEAALLKAYQRHRASRR